MKVQTITSLLARWNSKNGSFVPPLVTLTQWRSLSTEAFIGSSNISYFNHQHFPCSVHHSLMTTQPVYTLKEPIASTAISSRGIRSWGPLGRTSSPPVLPAIPILLWGSQNVAETEPIVACQQYFTTIRKMAHKVLSPRATARPITSDSPFILVQSRARARRSPLFDIAANYWFGWMRSVIQRLVRNLFSI